MFAVIYRGFILPEHEQAYRQAWREIADYFVQHAGALGSTLHKTPAGEYIAYSRWPDKATRDRYWDEQGNLQTVAGLNETIATLKMAIDRNKPYDEIAMEVVDETEKKIP
ncbi:MAG: hypothetical protein HKM04_09105 [Legionellales bacterium]|nr:hypothetical protein [Legionellales bacterium]